MNKTAAFEAGVIDAMLLHAEDLDKEAGILSVLSKGRAAVNKGGASAFGSLGKRLGGGRIAQAADVVANQGRQQAAKSKLIARGLDQGAARLAKAKTTGADVASAVSNKINVTKNPAQRMAMRGEVAETKKRLINKAKGVLPTPKPGLSIAPNPAAAKPSFLKRPSTLIAGGTALGVGGTYAAMNSGNGAQA